MTGVKRLTPPQSRKVNRLVKRSAATAITDTVFLLDDGGRNVSARSLFPIRFYANGFSLPYFLLISCCMQSFFKTEDKKRYTECGTFFVSKSNSVKYCPDCRKRITRRQAAERMRNDAPPCYAVGAKSLDLQGITDTKLA